MTNETKRENSSYKLLCGGHVWQWKNISSDTPDADKESVSSYSYIPPRGAFQQQHILVDAYKGTIVEVFPLTTDIASILQKYPAEQFDMKAKFILPGLQESHVHVAATAIGRTFVNLENSTSIEEIGKRLQKAAAVNPNAHCIVGKRWEQQKFGGTNPEMPTRFDLDCFFPTKPVFLYRICYHFLVCNTAAMKLCHLDPLHPETWPPSVPLQHCFFTADGSPLGIFQEDAITYLHPFITVPPDELYTLLKEEMQFFAANGITAVQSNDWHTDALYVRMLSEGTLVLRLYHTIFFEELHAWLVDAYRRNHLLPHDLPVSLEELALFSRNVSKTSLRSYAGYGPYLKKAECGTLLSCDRVKLFVDGTLGGQTAALRKPYVAPSAPNLPHETNAAPPLSSKKTSCRGRNFGVLRESAGDLEHKLAIIKNCDLRVEVHAIGDAAAELVLNGVSTTGMIGLYHLPVLTHCQFLGADLIKLMQQYNVIGNIQPSFLPSDTYLLADFIDETLLPYSYAWKTMLQQGIACAGGSDSPIEYPSALKGMFDAMYRPSTHFYPHSLKVALSYLQTLKNNSNNKKEGKTNREEVVVEEEFHKMATPSPLPPIPDRERECLSFEEALALYTIGASFAAKSDVRTQGSQQKSLTGRIQAGYLADFTVLDQDISIESYRSLMETNVVQTWVNGKIVYMQKMQAVK